MGRSQVERARWGVVASVLSLAMAGCVAPASPSQPERVASPSAQDPAGAPASPAADETGAARPGPSSLQEAIDALASEHGSAVIALVETPAGTWRGAAGEAAEGGSPDPAARFDIASTTKSFTAAVVLQLVGERALALDDTVEAWLPGVVTEGETVTIRQLLNHTSGLVGDDGPPSYEPGTRFSYSNAGYALLGEVVEAVTGKPIDVEVGERLIGPLGLAATTYGTAGVPIDQEGLPDWLGVPGHPSSSPSGAGGIVSTAEDLATFFRALRRGDLLREEQLTEMMETVSAGADIEAGLGIFRLELDCGATWGHGGDVVFYSNQVLVSPDSETTVIVAQDEGGWPAVNATAAQMYCL